jgi:uncharacterized protein (DUF1499 family)
MFARIALWLGILALGGAVVGPLLAHLEVVSPMVGFGILALGLIDAILALICGGIAMIRGSGSDRGTALRGMIPAAFVLLAVLGAASRGGNVPRINDITTDTTNPPQFTHAQRLPGNAGRDMSYQGESFASQQRQGYGEIAPLKLNQPPPEAFAAVLEKAYGMKTWEVTLADPGTRTIEGIDTTYLFRFKDDFVIEVHPGPGGGSLVQMRSKSRDGQGDVGANAKRIRAFFALFQ